MPNLQNHDDDLNKVIKLVTKISPKVTTEQNNIRALVQTYWGQFKIEWNGGEGDWIECQKILKDYLLPNVHKLEANPH